MAYDKICIMLPTYKRSKTYLPAFIESAIKTVEDKSKINFLFCVNDRDTDTQEFLIDYDFQGVDYDLVVESLVKPHLAKYFNMMYDLVKHRGEPGTVVTMFGDDMVFRTQGWEGRMLNLINQYKGTGVFWANDDYIARERCAVNLFVTQQFVGATEHPFMCEEFSCDMIDVVWTEVGRLTRTSHFDPDTHIWHNHNYNKPEVQRDETYKRLDYKGVHADGGKDRAKHIAKQIADVLIAKNMTGDSIC